jgi:hypothetical protein
MRSISGVVLGAFLLWLVYILSPLFALASLAHSVRAGDVAAVEARIDVKALRTSLARQVGQAYMRATGAQKDQGATQQFGAAAAAAIVDPLLAPYLTPAALMEMIKTGRVPGAPEGLAAGTRGVVDDLDLGRMLNLEVARGLFFASEWRGFRAFLLALPLDQPMPERFRLEMQLSGLTWKVAGLELPAAVRDRIVQQIISRGGGA